VKGQDFQIALLLLGAYSIGDWLSVCLSGCLCVVKLFSNRYSFYSFLSRVSILTRDIDIANLSVRPSVRPLRSGIV